MQISKHMIKNRHFPRYFLGPPLISLSSSSVHLFFRSLDSPYHLQKPLHYLPGSISSDDRITAPPLQFCSSPSNSGCIASFAHQVFDIRFLRPRARLFSITSASNLSPPVKMMNKRNNFKGKRFSSKLTAEERAVIVDAIKQDGGTSLDGHLNKVADRLSIDCLSRIFSVLNGQRVSGLPLFVWVLNMKHNLYRNSNFCSLIVDNCGWLGDYESMASILNDFKSKNLCLTSKAFSFLPVLNSSNKYVLMESITKVIQVLDRVGGSCRSSGIVGMIEILCRLEAFEMADFVMNITERKPQYYKVVVREKCKKCHFEDARKTLEDMRHFHCEPDVNIYNYLLSSLCKNGKLDEAHSVFEEMKNNGNHPDALTFDIFIHFTAREGMLEAATEFLNEMINMGLKPRISTHAVIIKGFLNLGRLEECKEYGINAEVVEFHKRHKNMIYCLLADFHRQKGDISRAGSILIKMMDKCLKPNLSVYRRVLNQMKNDGLEEMARDLKSRFSSFKLDSSSAAAAVIA